MHEASEAQAKNGNWALAHGPLIWISHYLFRVFPGCVWERRFIYQERFIYKCSLPYCNINIKLKSVRSLLPLVLGRLHSSSSNELIDTAVLVRVWSPWFLSKLLELKVSIICFLFLHQYPAPSKHRHQTLLDIDERSLLCVPWDILSPRTIIHLESICMVSQILTNKTLHRQRKRLSQWALEF